MTACWSEPEQAVEHGRVGGAVAAWLGQGQLEEVAQLGSVQDHSDAMFVVA